MTSHHGMAGRGRLSARLLLSACLPAVIALWTPAASAQDTPNQATPPAPKESARYAGIESVTITARKKEERQIDVPVAAAVLPSESIEKYATTDLTQLGTQLPGVQINRTGGGTPGSAIYIRGIGVYGPDYASEQPVAVVIDGVPVGRGHFVDSGFFDQASIQVLKGPQSLFFGKNTPAGVIVIDSKSPEPGEFEGYAKASYGFRQQDPILEGAVSLPVSNKFAIRLAIRGEAMQGGYMRNGTTGITVTPAEFPDPFYTGPTELPGAAYKKYPRTHQLVGRFTAVWTPNDDFDVTLKQLASYYHDNSSSGSSALVHCDNGRHPVYANLLTGITYEDPNATCGLKRENNTAALSKPILDAFIGAPKDGKYFTEGRNYLTSLKMNYTMGDFTLTSVTGLYLLRSSEFDNYDYTVFAETPDKQVERTRVFTQDLHLVSHFDGPVNFTVGAYFEDEHRILHNTNRIFVLPGYPDPTSPYFGASNTMIDYDVNNNVSYSLFGELTWKITDTLELAGGGRWSKVSKDTHITQPFEWLTLFGAGNPFAPTGADYHVKVKGDNFSPQATLTWHPVDDLTVYGAYRTGFLAGGIGNPGVVTNYTGFTDEQLHNALAFDDEKAEGFEVGAKGIFLDGRLSGDLTFYHYKYTGLQVATFHPETTSFSIGNAASAINQGVELQSTFQFDDHLNAHVSVAYVDLHFKDYSNAPCYSGQTAATGCVALPTPHQDLSGEAFQAPPWTFNLGADYDHELTDKLNIGVSFDVTHWTTVHNRQPNTDFLAHTILNASIRIYEAGGGWEFALIGTNLTNEIYATGLGSKPLGAPQDITGVINPGRELRLQVTRTF